MDQVIWTLLFGFGFGLAATIPPGPINALFREIFAADRVATRIADATGLEAESWMAANQQLLIGLRSQSSSSYTIQFFVFLAVAIGIASVVGAGIFVTVLGLNLLGDWLRDYFFRPIYKSLSGVQRLRTWPLLKQNIALFSTFLLMGCWNGLEAHYIASGALFGLYSVGYNSYQHQSRKHKWNFWGSTPAWLVKGLSIFVMVHLACFALYIFSGRFPYLH